MSDKIWVTALIDKKLAEEAKRLLELEDRSMSQLIRAAVRELIARHKEAKLAGRTA